MNANHLINMVIRMVLGPLIRRGVDAGIDRVVGKGKATHDMTPEEREQARSAKQGVSRARQMSRMARRVGRF